MKGFKPFGGVTGRTSAALFEIRYVLLVHFGADHVLTVASLDSDVIVLRGVESEASSQLLKGVVVLCLPSALKVEDVHLRMTGHLRVGYAPHPVVTLKQSARKALTVPQQLD